jgi:hypothetical protein
MFNFFPGLELATKAWTPAELFSEPGLTPFCWFDAGDRGNTFTNTALTTPYVSNGDSIKGFRDRYALHNGTQATTPPTVSQGYSPTGLDCLAFNGSTQFLDLASAAAITGDFSVAFVGHPSNAGGNQTVISGGVNAAGMNYDGNPLPRLIKQDTNDLAKWAGANASTSGLQCFIGVYSGADGNDVARLQRAANLGNHTNDNPSGNVLYLGKYSSGSFFGGKFGELIVCKGQFSSLVIEKIERYARRWGI